MQKVIGVRLRKAGKIHYYKPGQVEIAKGDYVVIETAQGLECVEVIIAPRELANDKFKIEFIKRRASSLDIKRLKENKKLEQEAFDVCSQKIAEHNLPMTLIEVTYSFDASKIVFSFTASGRVDFRELVKDLASIFHTRIELHQVGVRDEAKFMGGVGCCGRALCCSTFLGDFIPVSIRMAKEQSLSLNPAKISGICGRLMCCLKFENDFYRERYPHVVIKDPKLGDRVIVDEGEGKIISLNQQRRTATIILDNSRTVIESFDNIFDAEIDIEEAQTIVAPQVEENNETENVVIEKKNTSYKSDYKSDKYNTRNNRRTPSPSTLIPSKPSYQQNKSFLSTQNKFSSTIQSKPVTSPPSNRFNSSQVKQNSSVTPQTKSETQKIKSRGRDERGKDNRKYNKKSRRVEDYQRNKKFRPRRPELNDDEG